MSTGQKKMINELKNYLQLIAAQNATRFLSQAWIEVWVQEDDLEVDSTVLELKKSDLSLEEKVKKVKDLAQEVARQMMLDVNMSAGEKGVEINSETMDFDSANDKIDWEKLVTPGTEDYSGSSPHTGAPPNVIESFLKGFYKNAQPGLELFTQTTEEDWYQRLNEMSLGHELSEDQLKTLWNHFTQSAKRDVAKVDPMQLYLEDYNQLKRAFDKFAEEKGFQDWKYGTSDAEWLDPR